MSRKGELLVVALACALSCGHASGGPTAPGTRSATDASGSVSDACPTSQAPTGSVSAMPGLVLFEGTTGGVSAALSDTWRWDGTAWTELAVTGPSARAGAGAASLDQKLVLFGGDHPVPGALVGECQPADTWTWDGGAWSRREVHGPAGRRVSKRRRVSGKRGVAEVLSCQAS